MRNVLKQTIGTTAALSMLLGMAGGATAATTGALTSTRITDTKHNLSPSSTNTIKSANGTEICVYCHTPHNAQVNGSIPLWNHTMPSGGASSYGSYDSATFDGAATVADLERGGVTSNTTVSNLCLSCHDGTVAINSVFNDSLFGANDGGTASAALGSVGTNLGTDLANDHPINFDYAAASTADGTLETAAGILTAGFQLFGGKMQCATCHNPHGSNDSSGKGFVRVTMAGSAMCLACHLK